MAKSKSGKTKTTEVADAPVVTKVRHISAKPKRSLGEELRIGALGAELVGTFILTAAVLNTGGNIVVAGITVLIVILMLAKISGAHINPAVTLSMLALRKISGIKAAGYVVAQLLGGMLALVIISQFVNGSAADPTSSQMPHVFEPAPLTELWRPFFGELLGGIVFGLGIAAVALGRKEGHEAAFTIGGALLLGLFAASSTLGAVAILNPAVAMGLNAFQLDDKGVSLAVYALAPILGAIAGAWMYKLFQMDVKDADA